MKFIANKRSFCILVSLNFLLFACSSIDESCNPGRNCAFPTVLANKWGLIKVLNKSSGMDESSANMPQVLIFTLSDTYMYSTAPEPGMVRCDFGAEGNKGDYGSSPDMVDAGKSGTITFKPKSGFMNTVTFSLSEDTRFLVLDFYNPFTDTDYELTYAKLF